MGLLPILLDQISKKTIRVVVFHLRVASPTYSTPPMSFHNAKLESSSTELSSKEESLSSSNELPENSYTSLKGPKYLCGVSAPINGMLSHGSSTSLKPRKKKQCFLFATDTLPRVTTASWAASSPRDYHIKNDLGSPVPGCLAERILTLAKNRPFFDLMPFGQKTKSFFD